MVKAGLLVNMAGKAEPQTYYSLGYTFMGLGSIRVGDGYCSLVETSSGSFIGSLVYGYRSLGGWCSSGGLVKWEERK